MLSIRRRGNFNYMKLVISRVISTVIFGAILFVISVPVALSQKNKGLVVDGVSFENVLIGKSTMKDVIAQYGSNYQLEDLGGYSFELTYKALGLAFYGCQADPNKEIFDVTIIAPAKVRTSKGIVLGKTTLADVYRIYKKQGEKTFSDSDQEGIYFFISEEDDVDEIYKPIVTFPNLKAERLHNAKVIKRIELVERSGARQCDSMFPATGN